MLAPKGDQVTGSVLGRRQKGRQWVRDAGTVWDGLESGGEGGSKRAKAPTRGDTHVFQLAGSRSELGMAKQPQLLITVETE